MLSILVSLNTARVSDRLVRAVRKVHEVLELFTQSKLGDTDSKGDAEEYKTIVFASALLVLLAVLVWLLTVKVWFE